MKNSFAELFFDSTHEILEDKEEDYTLAEHYIQSFEKMSTMIDESVYVVDFRKKCFLFVAPNPFFLCNHKPGEVQELGYNYYAKVVFKEDIPLLINIHKITLAFFNSPERIQDLEYISFNFRIINCEKIFMVNHKIKPIFATKDEKIWMALCTVSTSAQRQVGNIYAYYAHRQNCLHYSLESRKWKEEPITKLTKREQDILKLSKQGKQTKEIADILNVSSNTIRCQKNELYKKLNTQTMVESIIKVSNRWLI